MGPPSRGPRYPTSNPLPTDFSSHPESHQQPSTRPDQFLSQAPFVLDTSSISKRAPPLYSTLSQHHDTSQSVILDDGDLLNGVNLETQDQAIDLLEDLADQIIPYTSIQNGSEVFQPDPWNPVGAMISSMHTPSEQLLSNPQQSRKRPITDSGYGTVSQKSRRIEPYQQGAGGPIERGLLHPNNDPLDSVAQQKHYLFDQQQSQSQRGPPTVVSTHTPRPAPSVVADSTVITSFRCEECGDTTVTKSELKKHMARHDKKHKCDFPRCGRGTKGFATKNDLERHKAEVHHDETISRKVYQCSVPGCKDPLKKWSRKDNFKAHVKRMHKHLNPELVVMHSFVYERGPSTTQRTISHADSQPQQPTPHMYPHTDATQQLSPGHLPYVHGGMDTDLDDGDMYWPPVNPSQRQQQSYLGRPNDNPYSSQRTVQSSIFPSSVTVGPSSHAASNSLLPTSTQYNGTPPPMPLRYNDGILSSLHAPTTRIFDTQTAPDIGRNVVEDLQGTMYAYGPGSFDAFMVTGLPTPVIDPLLQKIGTIGSGSWMSSTASYPQQAELPDQTPPSAGSVATENQPQVVEGSDEPRDTVWEQFLSILNLTKDRLTKDQLKTMIKIWSKHPSSSNKSSCVIQSTLDAMKAFDGGERAPKTFQCSRSGCNKSFSQNNIRKKHEKRHDRAFFCTYDFCYSTFGSKDDLRRHEKSHEKKKSISQDYEGWRCFPGDVPTSHHKTECSKYFDNKEKFEQHRRDDHRERATTNKGGLKALRSCYVYQGYPGNFWCGFCVEVKQNDPDVTNGTRCDKVRYDHIDAHITREGRTIDQWVDLKSEGLTKTHVKSTQQQSDLPTNESDEDDDLDVEESPPPATSATVSGPSSQIPAARSSRHLIIPPLPGTNRKRSRSDAGRIPYPVAKQLRLTTMPAPRQACTVTRETSDMARPGLDASTQSLQPAAITMVTCCHCKCKTDHVAGLITCGTLVCFHQYCSSCTFWDNSGTRVVPKANSGRGRGNNN